MFFRFGTALALVVLISLVGTALEKRSLELKRGVSRQRYRLDILEAQYARSRVLAEQQGAPARLMDRVEAEPAPMEQPAKPAQGGRKPGRTKRHRAVAPTAKVP